jgi:drug/metabolite transporter (DMT)-like permease
VAFHWLLAHQSATLVSTSAFVNPLVATVLGIVVAHERAMPLQLAGAAILLVNIILIWQFEAPLQRQMNVASGARVEG